MQSQQVRFNDKVLGCNHTLRAVRIENGSTVYLFIVDDGHEDTNWTVECNGYLELNSCVPAITPDHKREADSEDDVQEDDIWSIRIEAFSVHSESDGRGRCEQIGIVCYQYNGKVEWSLNGVWYKSGDVVLRNMTMSDSDGFEEMYSEIFGTAMDHKFVGTAFRVDEYGTIYPFSDDADEGIGGIEVFWLNALIAAYRKRGKRCIDIESHQRKCGRWRWDISQYECSMCSNDEYIAKESNNYSLLTEPYECSL